MKSKPRKFLPKLLPALLAAHVPAALAFEPVKFDDGSVLDISLHVNYTNMKRLKDPVLIEDYKVRYSSPSNGVVNPNPYGLFKGSLWKPAVEAFTQLETRMNADDGDAAVAKHGTISNRVSALLELNLTKDNYRAFLRGNVFRDDALFQPNADLSPGTYNGVGPSNQYTDAARRQIGQRARLLDAYIQGRWKLGSAGDYPLFVKYGRQVVNWGEGLMFQGIGSSMNANDQVKGLTPGVPAQEAFLPVEQIYGTLGVSDRLTLMAYKKLKFQPSEYAPRGTYWSPDDGFTAGGDYLSALPWNAWPPEVLQQAYREILKSPMPARLFQGLPTGSYGAFRLPDIGVTAKGQWGLGAKYQMTDQTDIGLYHLRYTETVGFPQFSFGTDWWKLGQGKVSSVRGSPNYDDQASLLTLINWLTPFNNAFALRYMNDIRLTGASFSTRLGDYSVAGEVAYRSGAPLMLSNRHYELARSRILNGNVSALLAMPGREFLNGWTGAQSVIVGGELAVEHLLGFDVPGYSVAAWQAGWPKGPAEPVFDRTAVATCLRLELAYTPFQEWDLSIPMFYWREFIGNGPVQGGWNSGLMGANSGRVSVETKFTYKQNLELGMTMTHFLGDFDLRWHNFNMYQDRDFVSFNAAYHF